MNNINFYKDLYLKASDYLTKNGLNPLPEITISITWLWSRRTLGQVCSKRQDGRYIPDVLMMNARFEHVEESKRIETFMHEVAHVYCIYYYGEYGHTPLFNRIAKCLGAVGGKYQQTDKIEAAMQNREKAIKKFTEQAFTELNKRDIHSMRCSLKMIARKYGIQADRNTFIQYVAPRYRYIYSAQQIKQAEDVIFA